MRSINENLDNPAVAKAIALSLRTHIQFAVGDLKKEHIAEIAYADDQATKAFIEVCDEDSAPRTQVKPLELDDRGDVVWAKCPWGTYIVTDAGHNGWGIWFHSGTGKVLIEWKFVDKDAAIENLQIHHRMKVLGMLEGE